MKSEKWPLGAGSQLALLVGAGRFCAGIEPSAFRLSVLFFVPSEKRFSAFGWKK